MQTCNTCGQKKDESEFRKNRPCQCKKCHSNYQVKYFRNAPKATKAKRYALEGKRRRKMVLRMLRYLAEHPCVDCGESDPVILEFDHREEKEKSYTVSKFGQRKWETILKEIAKCDIRCCNCHRRRTAKQFGWYAYLEEEPE